MTEAEKKDKILNFLNDKSNRGNFQHAQVCGLLGLNHPQEMPYAMSLLNELHDDGLIILNDHVFGYEYKIEAFLKNGGYVKKEQQDEVTKQELEKIEGYKKTKLKYDAMLSKWQVKIFWPVFIFTLIGSALGIISFFLQIFGE